MFTANSIIGGSCHRVDFFVSVWKEIFLSYQPLTPNPNHKTFFKEIVKFIDTMPNNEIAINYNGFGNVSESFKQ